MIGSIIVIILALAFGVGFLTIFLEYNKANRLRVRDPLNKNSYVIDYLMVEKKEKAEGVVYWQSVWWQKKIRTPEPPKECIEVGKKGKKFVEAYKLTEDEYIFITDKGIKLEHIENKETGRTELKIMDIGIDGKITEIDTFKPYSVTQRDVLVSQHRKAEEISHKGWGTAEIMGVVSVGALVMVIVVMLIFGADLLAEYRTSRVFNTDMVRMQAETTRATAALIDAMGIDINDMDITIAQSPQAQSGGGVPTDSENLPEVISILKGELDK